MERAEARAGPRLLHRLLQLQRVRPAADAVEDCAGHVAVRVHLCKAEDDGGDAAGRRAMQEGRAGGVWEWRGREGGV